MPLFWVFSFLAVLLLMMSLGVVYSVSMVKYLGELDFKSDFSMKWLW